MNNDCFDNKIYGIICDVGGKNKGNQDSAVYLEFDIVIAPGDIESKSFSGKCILSIVADGVSASSHGEKGSTFVVRTFTSKILHYLISDNVDLPQIQEKIHDLIIEVNAELLLKYKLEIQGGKVPKSTIVGILIIGQWLWVFNLGDSRAFVIKDNQISQISVDHIGSSASHEITQAIGQTEVSPEIRAFNWAFEGDYSGKLRAFKSEYFFLICSDGLTDKVSPDEIKEEIGGIQTSQTMQNRVNTLYFKTIERGIDDNVSIIAVDLARYFESLSPIQILKLSYRGQGGT